MLTSHLSNSFIYQSSKIPLSTKRSNSQTKQPLIMIQHIHISSQYSPLCRQCGGIFFNSESKNQKIISLKPKCLNYIPEISQFETLDQLKRQIYSQQLPEYVHNKDMDINALRKKMIVRIHNFKNKLKMNRSSMYLGILLMDILIAKEKAISFHKIEQFGMGAYILAMKYIELTITITSIKQFQFTFENASEYSCEHIRKMETNVLKKLNYKLNYISFFNVIQFFLMNGIVFTVDTITEKYTSIYFLVEQICDIILENGLYYLNYNPILLACAIIALARQLSHHEKWPTIFNELYSVDELSFQNEFEFIYEIYMRKTQMVELNQKNKITRNTTLNSKNNLYKMKDKGFFNSNNCNFHNNSNFLKKIFDNRKLLSKSMDTTHNLSTARNASAKPKNKNNLNNNYINHNGLRNTNSKEHIKDNKHNRRLSDNIRQFINIDCISQSNIRVNSVKKEPSRVEKPSNLQKINKKINNHVKSTCNIHRHSRAGKNDYNNNHIIKENKQLYNSNAGKEYFSLNSSYCTATETIINYHSTKIQNKKSNSIINHENIHDYKSKNTNDSTKIQNQKNGTNVISYPINVDQSFHKQLNNNNKNNHNNNKINQDYIYLTNKKNDFKRKIDIIEEMTLNKLSFISNRGKKIYEKQNSFSTQKIIQIKGNNKYMNRRHNKKNIDLYYRKKINKNNNES